jgi:hypothetical protein
LQDSDIGGYILVSIYTHKVGTSVRTGWVLQDSDAGGGSYLSIQTEWVHQGGYYWMRQRVDKLTCKFFPWVVPSRQEAATRQWGGLNDYRTE